MDGREFIIVTPIKAEGELTDNPIIQKINTIIEFINKNRYRLPAEADNKYKVENPKADMRKDIELREKLAMDMSSQTNVLGIIQQVQEALEKKNLGQKTKQDTFKNFKLVLDSFLQHIQFVHLTAVELAIVGMMIDTLIILLYQAQNDLRGDAAHISVLNKQNELLRIRGNLAECMAYHRTVFAENNAKKDKEEFYYSDIVINFYDAIETGTDIKLADERKNLWPDMSFLQVLPEIPFYKTVEPKTVAKYFKEFIESTPPGVEQIGRLQDDIRDELDLLSEEERNASANDQDDTTTPGCFSFLFWYAANAQKKDEQKPISRIESFELDEFEVTEEEIAPITEKQKIQLDDIIRLMHSFNNKAQEKLDKMEFEKNLRDDLVLLRDKLQKEIMDLRKPSCFSCFSFFWAATIRKKLYKEATLSYVLQAATLEELNQRAYDKLHGEDKDLVCAGWHSRTEAALTRVANAVLLRPVDITQAEMEFL